MDNIVTYAETVFDRFDARPLGPVDSLIFSWLSYLHLPADMPEVRDCRGVRLADLLRAECFDDMFAGVWDPASTRRLLTALAANPRTRDVRVFGFTEQFDEREEKQFAAVSFHLAPSLCYVAFRGTDATLVGWKEDFNMAFKCPVPAQEAAVRYLEQTAVQVEGRLVTGGHSKGGNLAVYAAVKCDAAVRDRIVAAYSHDGPGFMQSVIDGADFKAMAPRIQKTVPQSSVVGMLLENQEDYDVVKSRQISLWQHDPFSWEVADGEFVQVEKLAGDALYLDHTLSGWLHTMSEDDRARFVNALFEVLEATDAETMGDIGADWQRSIPAAARALSRMDPDTRGFLFRVLGELAKLGAKGVPETLGATLTAARGEGAAGILRSGSAPAE